MIDRNPGIIHNRMRHAERVCLRRPAEVIESPRPVALAGCIQLEDGDHLPLFRLFQRVAIMEPPPPRGIAAKGFPLILRVAARARHDVQNTHFEYIARLGALDRHRPGADMSAETAAGAYLTVHRTDTATIHVLLLGIPVKYTFGSGVPARSEE